MVLIRRLTCKICGKPFRKNLNRDWSESCCDDCAAEIARIEAATRAALSCDSAAKNTAVAAARPAGGEG